MRVKNANKKYREFIWIPGTYCYLRNLNITPFGFSVDIYGNSTMREPHVLPDVPVEESFTLQVTNPVPVPLTVHQVTTIIIGLLQNKYKKINLDWGCIPDFSHLTNAEICNRGYGPKPVITERKNTVINLSGGQDSVTLAALCPELKRFSVNLFPGSEEDVICKKLNAIQCETNQPDFLFLHNPVAYYNMTTLLNADKYSIKYTCDARLMTDATDGFRYLMNKEVPLQVNNMPPEIYGIKILYPMIGFTAIGIQKVLHRLQPDWYSQSYSASIMLIDGQLTPKYSIAPQKSIMKNLIAECLWHGPLDPLLQDEVREWNYVTNPMVCFYGIYLLKYLRNAQNIDLFTKGVTQRDYNFVSNMRLDFYEKYDQNALKSLPEDFREYFTNKLNNAGVEFYTDFDYEERLKVLKYITAIGV